MILDFIFEHIPFLKQIPHFSSCRVFETYPGFETITRIHINVNFQVFKHLRHKTRFFDKIKYTQKGKKQTICSFIIIKLLRHSEIKIKDYFFTIKIN